MKISQVDYIKILKMIQVQLHKKNLRKDVSTLKGPQRKRFFWCLKMLGILPPPKAFSGWQYIDIVDITQKPVCLHDVLIASHATTCQHACLYFPSYHRNQLMLTQLFLNYADQVLTNRVIPEKYKSEALQPLWEQVFKEYAEIKTTEKGKVLIHYWNPTNYENSSSILYPPELTERSQEKYDSMDKLFKEIRKSWPWCINPSERLFNNNQAQFKDKKQFRKKAKDVIEKNKRFRGDYILFKQDGAAKLQQYLNSPSYKDLIVQGSTNLRSNTRNGYSYFVQFRNTYNQLVGYRNNKDYVEGKRQDLKVLNLTNDEVLVNYNSKQKNMHYMSLNQQKNYEKDKIALSLIQRINANTPHYTLANAIYGGKKFQDFAKDQDALTRPHDTMHLVSGIFMNHGDYSPTSFIFFLYHSWIDAAFEIRVRTDKSKAEDIEKFMHQRLTAAGPYLAFSSFFNSRQGQKIKQKLNNLQVNDQLTSSNVGFYPVLSWTNIQTLKFEGYFSAYEYYLRQNGTELRKSYQMGEIYKTRFYQVIKNDFKEYTGFANFDYDYNYEYLSGQKDTTVLDPEQEGGNIPLYLQVIAADFTNSGTTIRIRDQAKAIAHPSTQGEAPQSNVKPVLLKSSPPPQVTTQTEKKVEVNNLQVVKSRKKEVIQTIANQLENSQPAVYYQKLLRKSLAVLVKHQSTISSDIYQIGIKLKNCQDIKQHISEPYLQYFEKVEKEGAILHSYPIFSKGQAAKHCIKCKQFKYDILELGSNLFSSFPQLWRQIGKCILPKNGVVATTKNEVSTNCYTQRLQAFVDEPLQVRLITGAEQVYFETSYDGDKKGTIRIEADSKSILKDQIVTTASHINYNLSKGFDFYKLWDSSLSGNYIDSFVYKNIRVIANIGGKVKSVRFSIPSYHKLIRYTLNINQDGDDYDIEVVDADYKFKEEFLKRYCPKSM